MIGVAAYGDADCHADARLRGYSSPMLLLLLACQRPTEEIGTATPPSEPSTLVWQGFTQSWTYNHRLNSLGDYVVSSCDDAGCEVELVHSAASGSGADTASYTSRATALFADGVDFRNGAVLCSLDRDDAEGRLLTCDQQVVLDVEADGALTTLMQGFEVRATDDADKLQRLSLRVGEPEASAGTVSFGVHAELKLDCDSLECDGVADKLDRSVHYEVRVSWALLAGDFASTEGTAGVAYTWDNASPADELDVADFVRAGTFSRDPAYEIATVGLRGLEVALDDDHHMVEWATVVEPGEDEGEALPFETTTLFKQWNAYSWDHLLAYTEPGSGRVTLDTVLVEARGGCAVPVEHEDAVAWAADGGPAEDGGRVYTGLDLARPEGC